MSHAIDMSNDRANIAYSGTVPWHGLGERVDPNTGIEEWRKAAGLNWEVESKVAHFSPDGKSMVAFPGRNVLHRSDTNAPLGIVGDNYHIVQPEEILEFYRDLMDRHDFKIEVAGALQGGKRVWALANTGQAFSLGKTDLINRYVLLATSYDTTMATTAMHTSVRVVCQNTLSFAVNNDSPRITVPHSVKFDAAATKVDLGLAEPWEYFQERVREMSKFKVSEEDAVRFFVRTYYGTDIEDEDSQSGIDIGDNSVINRIGTMLDLYENAPGQLESSANGTLWGLVNAVTYNQDHVSRARSTDNRLNSAWFGNGQKIKQAAWDTANTILEEAA